MHDTVHTAMKNCLLIALAAIIFSGCANKTTDNSLTTDGLNGSVKSVTSVCYEPILVNGNVQKGEPVFVRDYWMPLYSGCTNVYNADGNLARTTTFDQFGAITDVSVFEYRDNDCIATSIYDGEGELSYSWRIVFEDGKAIDYETYNRDGNDEGETIEYEFEGNHLKAESHFSYGRLIQAEHNTYQNGKLVLTTTTTADGTELLRYEQQWTGSGQVKSRRGIHNGVEGLFEEFTYNDHHQLISYTRSGSWANGDVRYTFDYLTFDQQGNWLTRVIYSASNPCFFEERTIEYY